MAGEQEPEAPKSTRQRGRASNHLWHGAFLAVLRQTANIRLACESAGVDRRGAYRAKERSPVFARQWQEALEEAADRLEAEALRRAVVGWDEPVYQGGVQVGVVRKYDSTLLITLLKAHRPEKFRERISVVTEDAMDAEIRRLEEEMARRDTRTRVERRPAGAPAPETPLP